MKTKFSRKAGNYKELKDGTWESENEQEYVIEKIIEISKEEWNKLKDNLLENNDIVIANKDCQYIEQNEVWHCIAIATKDSNEMIVVNCEGYDYLRYSSLIEK